MEHPSGVSTPNAKDYPHLYRWKHCRCWNSLEWLFVVERILCSIHSAGCVLQGGVIKCHYKRLHCVNINVWSRKASVLKTYTANNVNHKYLLQISSCFFFTQRRHWYIMIRYSRQISIRCTPWNLQALYSK